MYRIALYQSRSPAFLQFPVLCTEKLLPASLSTIHAIRMAPHPPADPASPQKPTALTLLREEIFRFLETDTPEVLCIRGKWGIGKTYTWEILLKEAQGAGKVKLASYSYVSLFGLDNLDRFKSSIFENVIPVASAGTDPNIETLGTNIKAVAKLAAAAWKPGLGALADHAAFLSVSQYIVCVDDLERKGEKLRIIDVLGLISLLRERRKCKVVLILNDEELSKEDQDAFEKYSEKVIDSSLIFEPTSKEACEIAIRGTTPNDDLIKEYAQKLDIANIRILKKLERLVRLIEPPLKNLDARITSQAINSLVLFGWAILAKKTALLNYVMNERQRNLLGLDDDKLTDEHKGFDALLDDYPFGRIDDFDRVILNGIKAGFFDIGKLVYEAHKLEQSFTKQTLEAEIQKPWDDYRDSFDNNGDEVSTALISTINMYAYALPASYVESAVRFLKGMNREPDALQIISTWVEANKGQPKEFFDNSERAFPVRDEDLRKAMDALVHTYADNRDPFDVLFDIAKNSGWSDEDITLLSNLTPDHFYRMFKMHRGFQLRAAVRKALELGKIGRSDPRYSTIANNARNALKQLASESPINAQRVQKLYEVDLDTPSSARG